MQKEPNIYDPAFVRAVFDRCGPRYRVWSQVASFGFIALWRSQCIASIPKPHSDAPLIYDLMAGTGETWGRVLRCFPKLKSITAVDISPQMIQRAIGRLHRERLDRIQLLEADVLAVGHKPGTADIVISTFGLKTFDASQQRRIAATVAEMLKPGGTFAMIEASDPRGWALRPLYRFYLDSVLPWVEHLFLRGAQDFTMIGVYTRNFSDCSNFAAALRAEGLVVKEHRYFFGCATGVSGHKPNGPTPQ